MLTDLCKDKFPEHFVFINPRMKAFYSGETLFRIWDKVRKKLDINITLYEATRHSLASIAACNGASLHAIKDVLGHTDIRTTLKYAHSNLQSQRIVFQEPDKVVHLVHNLSPKKINPYKKRIFETTFCQAVVFI
ncbi:MAG: tyrosine-type recombinase/integrase [Nitrospiria bacterium]